MAAMRLPQSSTRESELAWVVHGERQFYSKCLLLQVVMSVATEQTSFLAS